MALTEQTTLHSSLLCLNRLVWVRYYSKNKALENCIRKCSFTNLTVLEVVVAQVLNNGIMSEQAGFECQDRLKHLLYPSRSEEVEIL